MKLYHGTNTDFQTIELSKCRPNKDFGKGFYLTDIRSQAQAMAVRRCEFEGKGNPIVQVYEFDETFLKSQEMSVKVFEQVCEEWALFILQNRKAGKKPVHQYDIVVGPVADDGVVYQLNLYMQRLITMDTLVKELFYKKINQIFSTIHYISPLFYHNL